ncbi:hypothetical protein [Stenotrophomonas lactitubi]|uniref:hypothetical protein n=1 Tax=Stenotrophomonas lactitubi TaxID=2045214 RepID=UPI00320AF799
MTPNDIEARLAQYESRFAALEAEKEANTWFSTALIGSHPDSVLLLALIRGAIRTLRGKTGPEDQNPRTAGAIARLLELEDQVLKVQAVRKAVQEKEQAEARAAKLAQQQRQDQEVGALGKGIGRGEAADWER